MKIIVVYVFPMVGPQYLDLAARFLTSYYQFDAGFPHESLVVCNGGQPTDELGFFFGCMENVKLMYHDNSGYDIGAHQHASAENPCDLMLFFGSSSYIRGPGWLVRVVESFKKHGSTLYGVHGNRGHEAIGVQRHVRTTGYWIPPALFNQYPHKCTDPSHRYPIEHGPNCLTTWIRNRKLIPWIVSWKGEWRWESWDSFPGGFHRGAQQDLIFGDKLTCPPYYAVP